MHNASCIAGMAFTNAFLGINHSLAHVRANSIFLMVERMQYFYHVIEYNASKPSKFVSFPKYEPLLQIRDTQR